MNRLRSLILEPSPRHVAVAAAMTLAILLAILLGGYDVRFGTNIPEPGVRADYCAAVAVGFAIAIALWSFAPAALRGPMVIAWLARLLATLGLMLPYEKYYPLIDAYLYFRTGRDAASWPGFHFGMGTENIGALVWLFFRAIPPMYHVVKVIFAAIGLAALFIVHRAGSRLVGMHPAAFWYLLALWPSTLFWSSTLGKEPLTLLGMALCFAGVASLGGRARGPWLLFASGLTILLYIRVWLASVVGVPLLFLAAPAIRRNKLPAFAAAIVLVVVLALPIQYHFHLRSVDKFRTVIDTWSTLWDPQWNLSGVASRDTRDKLRAALLLPAAAVNTLVGPFPKSLANPFSVFGCLENWPLLFFVVRALANARKREGYPPAAVLWSLGAIVVWALLYAFMSSSRFRLQVFPLMVFVIAYYDGFRLNAAPAHAPAAAEDSSPPS